MALLGIISDTHGLLRPEAVEALRGAELILHAGDIGSDDVIEGLRQLAPVIAVRGNCDTGSWAEKYPLRQTVRVGDVRILLLHDRKELKGDPRRGGARVVISGHSHVASAEEKEGILWLNPGSAGRRRFRLPVTVALLKVEGETATAEIVPLTENI